MTDRQTVWKGAEPVKAPPLSIAVMQSVRILVTDLDGRTDCGDGRDCRFHAAEHVLSMRFGTVRIPAPYRRGFPCGSSWWIDVLSVCREVRPRRSSGTGSARLGMLSFRRDSSEHVGAFSGCFGPYWARAPATVCPPTVFAPAGRGFARLGLLRVGAVRVRRSLSSLL